jgi:phosphotransferase system HPr (HPr) family protein
MMRTLSVRVHFKYGLHARPAACLVKLLQGFQAQVSLRCADRIADARSILGVLTLAASFNTRLEVQASGVDEEGAIHAVGAFFQRSEEARPRLLEEPRRTIRPFVCQQTYE